jgi:hypothetical protein
MVNFQEQGIDPLSERAQQLRTLYEKGLPRLSDIVKDGAKMKGSMWISTERGGCFLVNVSINGDLIGPPIPTMSDNWFASTAEWIEEKKREEKASQEATTRRREGREEYAKGLRDKLGYAVGQRLWDEYVKLTGRIVEEKDPDTREAYISERAQVIEEMERDLDAIERAKNPPVGKSGRRSVTPGN